MNTGVRVVRGPDWNHDEEDGGEGHLGTVVEWREEEALVIWDSGEKKLYRCGKNAAEDLRVFDTAPVGAKFHFVKCNECTPLSLIFGIRWQCVDCVNYNLCTPCYMSNKHDLCHSFKRYVRDGQLGAVVGKREGSARIEARGIFPDAEVVRAHDWFEGNDDGGVSEDVGVVKEISNFDAYCKRNKVLVTVTDSTNYRQYTGRLGAKGKVDLKSTKAASGGFYYREHIPVLGREYLKEVELKHGDKVQVILEPDKLREIQKAHGLWDNHMSLLIGMTGEVDKMTPTGDVVVMYGTDFTGRMPIIYNTVCVTKIPVFTPGTKVRLVSDASLAERLQKPHGGWNIIMSKALGQVGKVFLTNIGNNLSVKARFRGRAWTINPVLLEETDDPVDSSENSSEDDTDDDPLDLSRMLFGDMMKEVKIQFNAMDRLSTKSDTKADKLVKAARNGEKKVVEEIIGENNELVNEKSDSRTALHEACLQGQLDIVIYLLENGASTEVKGEGGNTSLHFSAIGGNTECTEELLKRETKVNTVNNKNHTALHIAVLSQKSDVVRVLLSHNCDINTKDKNGDTPLHDAISKQMIEMVELFCAAPNVDFTIKNKRGFNAYHQAALTGHLLAIELMTEKNPELVQCKKSDGVTALHLAAINRHHKIIEYLVEKGKCPIDIVDNEYQTALMFAVAQADVLMVEYLVEHGANIQLKDKNGDTPLHLCIKSRNRAGISLSGTSTPGISIPGILMPDISAMSDVLMPGISSLCEQETPDEELRSFCFRHKIEQCEGNPQAMIACYLCQHGADRTTRNKIGKSPFEMSSVGFQIKSIVEKHLSPLKSSATGNAWEGLDFSYCRLCDENRPNKANAKFEPCGHVIVCTECATCMIKCSICKSAIESTVDISKDTTKCLKCHENDCQVMFKPCGHKITCLECALKIKVCPQCKIFIAFKKGPDGQELNHALERNVDEDKTLCPICCERRRDLVFQCGHYTCEKCSRQMQQCPMCKEDIVARIKLFI